MFNNTYIYLRVILGAEHENHIIICFFLLFYLTTFGSFSNLFFQFVILFIVSKNDGSSDEIQRNLNSFNTIKNNSSYSCRDYFRHFDHFSNFLGNK